MQILVLVQMPNAALSAGRAGPERGEALGIAAAHRGETRVTS
jgi:hypothetical protein